MLTPDQHFRFFAEFCQQELLIGGPDPHMKLVGWMAQADSCSWQESAWRGLCYCAVYNVPTAHALWTHLPADPGQFQEWVARNWDGIAFRRERKAIWGQPKDGVSNLGRCLQSAATWLNGKLATGIEPTWPNYETAFKDACSIYGFGRYIGQKFVEYCRRYLGTTAQVPDIRPKDGWSPRKALSLLYPEHSAALNDEGKNPLAIATVNELAAKTRHKLLYQFGVEVDYYLLQVLLCDYKQSIIGCRQFPGKSQDSELEYDARLTPHWGRCEQMYQARRALFPSQALGELAGWPRVRKELGYVLRDFGYTWSDLLYDFHKSKANLKQPVRWQ